MNRSVVFIAVLGLAFCAGCSKQTDPPGKQGSPSGASGQGAVAAPAAPTPAGPGLKGISVSEAQARAWGLPPAVFSFTFPDKADLLLAKAGARNQFYALAELYKDDKISESVSVSHVDLQGGPAAKFDLLAPVVMKRLQTALQRQLPGMKIVMSGTARLGDRTVHQFRTEFEITDTRMGDPGKYRAIWVALLPRPKSASTNGASLTMTVRQGSGSEIVDYEDFATKGLPGQIWRSFKLGGLDPL